MPGRKSQTGTHASKGGGELVVYNERQVGMIWECELVGRIGERIQGHLVDRWRMAGLESLREVRSGWGQGQGGRLSKI